MPLCDIDTDGPDDAPDDDDPVDDGVLDLDGLSLMMHSS